MGEKTKKKDRLFFSLFIFNSKVSPLSLSLFHGWYSLSQVLDYPEKTTPVNIMNDIISVESITRHICFIRGHKVIIDRDLAELYGVLTKALKQAVHRNINRFPEDFMFELTCKEETLLRSQNVTLEGK